MSVRSYFQKRAKDLLRAVEQRDPAAIAQLQAAGLSAEGFGLMKAQHLIATSAGFSKWGGPGGLTDAPDGELRGAIARLKPSAGSPPQLPRASQNGGEHIRRRAWRNVVVAAINEGLDRQLFTLQPGDRWSKRSYSAAAQSGETYAFTFGEDIPALGYVNDAGFDELVFHVALWPTTDAPSWIHAWNSGFRAGDVWGLGWLERRDGGWLQWSRTMGRSAFAARRNRLAVVAERHIEARGYRDRGPFKM